MACLTNKHDSSIGEHARMDNPVDLFLELIDFVDPVLFGENSDKNDKGIFLNNRAVLIAQYRLSQGGNIFIESLLQEVYDIYKESSLQEELKPFLESDFEKQNTVKHLLNSYALLSTKPIKVHKFEELDKLVIELDSMTDKDVSDSFANGLAIQPLLNLAENLFQSNDESLTQIGLRYVNLCNKVSSRLDLKLISAKIKTFYGIYFLETDDLQSAEILLSDMSQTSNFGDYLKQINAEALSVSRKNRGDLIEARILSDKAKHLKNTLKVGNMAPEFSSLIIPLGVDSLLIN